MTRSTPDTDGDGLNDCEELTYGTDPNVADTDGDGLSDGDEVHVYGTSLTDDDSDDDGLTDGEEIQYGTGVSDPDSDDDGLTDGDGLSDGVEVAYGTNPNDPDSDHDGLIDGQDVEFIQNAIDGMPLDVFKSPSGGNRNAALSNLDDIEALLKQNKVAKALQALQGLRKRFDGCGMQPDNNDWALVCDSQLTIRGVIDLLVSNLGG